MQLPKLFLCIFIIIGLEAFADDQCEVSDQVEKSARKFGFQQKVISQSDEEFKEFFPIQKWKLVKATRVSPKLCVLVLDLCLALNKADPLECSNARLEMLALKEGAFAKFEDAFKIPSRLRVAIGGIIEEAKTGILPTDFFYVELTGSSVVAALKSIYGRSPYAGFSGTISAKNSRYKDSKLVGDPDGKWDFDPTPDRTWKIVNPIFALDRGSTIETDDLRASQLDGDFHGYYSGSNGHVGPWMAAYLRKYFDAKLGWVDVELN